MALKFTLRPGYDPEEYAPCPIEGQPILKSRMITHLSDCSHKHLEFKRCKYNPLHWEKEEDIEAHQATCPDSFKELLDSLANSSGENKETCNIQTEEWSDNEKEDEEDNSK